MNSRKKGSRIEREYKELKESQGYICEKTKANRWGNQDYWNTFDVMGFHLEKNEMFFAQVKSNSTRGAIHKIKDFKMPTFIKKIVAVRYDKGTKEEKKHGMWREIVV